MPEFFVFASHTIASSRHFAVREDEWTLVAVVVIEMRNVYKRELAWHRLTNHRNYIIRGCIRSNARNKSALRGYKEDGIYT